MLGLHLHSKGNPQDVSLWAVNRGLSYTRGTGRLFDYLRGDPYRRGYGTGIDHVVSGDHEGLRVVLMAFASRLASGDAGEPVVAVAVSLPGQCPELSIRPERLTDHALGHGLQLESSEFNAAFRIDCAEPKFGYDVLSPTMMEFLLGDARAQKYHIRYDGPMLVVWREGKLGKVTELEDMLGFAHELVTRTAAFTFTSDWTLSKDQTRVPLTDIPTEAFGDIGSGAIHSKRTVQHRGHTVEQADHIMDSRGMRDWFTVVGIDYPRPWPTIMITPKEFVIANTKRGIVPRYSDEVLTGNAGFDAVFAVGSPRPQFAHTVLTPELIDWLMTTPRMRQVELIFISVILRPGRDNVTETKNLGRVEISGLGTLTEAETADELTELLCDAVDRLSPAVFTFGAEAAQH